MERYADGRKEQKEDFKNEIREYHGEYPSEFVDGKVTSLGINPDSTALVYELSYKMDNLVKRAGNNVILSLGKLFCDQLELLPSDRERDVDAYFGTPREYVTRISVDIPSGYTVNENSLSGLNRLILK